MEEEGEGLGCDNLYDESGGWSRERVFGRFQRSAHNFSELAHFPAESPNRKKLYNWLTRKSGVLFQKLPDD